MEERELFEHYEHQVWEFSSGFKKIIGLSVLINLLGFFAIAQFNLFTAKGCDTPYVGIVCQVLDSAYVASVFYGKGAEWESRPYNRTEIGDEDVVTIINVGERLEYPEGYFFKDEVAEVFPVNEFGNPISTTPTPKSENDLGVQVLPTPNEDVQKQKLPDTPWGGSTAPVYKNPPTAKSKKGKKDGIMSGESPKNLPGDDGTVAVKTTPKPTPSPTPTPDANAAKEEFNKTFNKAPLQTLADGVIAKVDSDKPEEKIDLKQSFKVVLDGTLTEEGGFDAEKTKFIGKQEGNPQMIKVAREAIQAIGDSKILGYLKELGVEKVNITFIQDDKQISAIIRSSQPNEQSARTVSSGFNVLLGVAKGNVKEPEIQALMSALKFKPEGKSFVINFAMPKDEAHKIIDQKLQEARQKKSQTKSSDGAKDEAVKGK